MQSLEVGQFAQFTGSSPVKFIISQVKVRNPYPLETPTPCQVEMSLSDSQLVLFVQLSPSVALYSATNASQLGFQGAGRAIDIFNGL